MRISVRIWISTVLVGAAGSGFVWAASQSPHHSAVAPFQIVYATRDTVEVTASAMGRLHPVRGVDVGTQVSGQLKRLHVGIGDAIKTGDLIAEIDPIGFQARVDAGAATMASLQAQLVEKEAQLALAHSEFKRKQALALSGSASKSALDTQAASLKAAGAAMNMVKAQIRQAKANLDFDAFNLGNTKIFAPMSGTVVSLSASQGQTLSAVQEAPTILGIADLRTMTVEAYVSEADIGKLAVGMEASFSVLSHPTRSWVAQIRKINPQPEVINNVILYKALFDVPNPDGALMIGMTAQVFFTLAKAEDAVSVPIAALLPFHSHSGVAAQSAGNVEGPSRYLIRVQGDDGTTQQREVVVGLQNRVIAVVIKGLNEGEKVVLGAE